MIPSLQAHILQEMSIVPEANRLDRAISNVCLADAYCLHMDDPISDIAHRQYHLGKNTIVDYGDISDAFPPLTGKNLFIDFSAESAMYEGNNADTFGLHIVDWDTCKNAPIIKRSFFGEVPRSNIEEAYGIGLYYRNGERISLYPLTSIIGLDSAGRVSYREFIWNSAEKCPRSQARLEKLRGQFCWYIFLSFTAFFQINQANYSLQWLGQKRFMACPPDESRKGL